MWERHTGTGILICAVVLKARVICGARSIVAAEGWVRSMELVRKRVDCMVFGLVTSGEGGSNGRSEH